MNRAHDVNSPTTAQNSDENLAEHGGIVSDQYLLPVPSFKRKLTKVKEYDRTQQPRFCFGCFRTRRNCCLTWILLVVLLLVGIGLAVFFVFPRIKSVVVSDPFITAPDASNAIDIQGNFISASKSAPFSVSLKFAVNVTIDSASYIDYAVSNILVSGNTLYSNGDSVPGVTISGEGQDYVVAKTAVSVLALPMNVSYTSTQSALSANLDPFLYYFLTTCVSASDTLPIVINAQLTIPLISWTGYKPSIQQRTNVNCPMTGADLLDAVLNPTSSNFLAAIFAQLHI